MRIGLFLSTLLLLASCGKDNASSDDGLETGNDTGILDRDGDGFADDEDCDPDDRYTYPGADDVPYDGKDNDCCCVTEGEESECCGDLVDWDGDGYDAESAGGTDCNDGNPDVYPGAPEVCYDGIDQDCAGDEDTDDCDHDGYDRFTDCNDEDPNSYPGAEEVWYDGQDQDCAGPGVSDYDQDYDGQDHWDYGDGTDCDDEDPEAYLGADERWDGTDRDCDTLVDRLTERDGNREWYANTADIEGLMGFGAGILGDLDGDGGLDVAVSGIGISIPDADGNETVGFYGSTYVLDFGDETDGDMIDVAHGMVKPSSQEYHGYDAASLSDLDGDGLREYVVGVPGYVSGTTQGTAEYYSGAVLLAGGNMSPDFNIFGNSLAGVDVANLGDIDGDGLDELGIGPREYSGATLNIFSGATLGNATGDVSKSSALTTLSGSTAGGRTVGGLDFDQDGYGDILMGMDWDVEGDVALISGIDILSGSASPGSAATLTGPAGSFVGHSNGWLDDATGDGYPEVVVSAPGVDGDKTGSGVVYVIDGDDLPSNTKNAANTAFYTVLGNVETGRMISAENSGDFDGDGIADLVVSHPGDFLELQNYGVKGRTFVHWGPDVRAGGTVESKETDVEFNSTGSDDLFGYNHLIGDLDGDGTDDLLILAPGANGLSGYAIAFISYL